MRQTRLKACVLRIISFGGGIGRQNRMSVIPRCSYPSTVYFCPCFLAFPRLSSIVVQVERAMDRKNLLRVHT